MATKFGEIIEASEPISKGLQQGIGQGMVLGAKKEQNQMSMLNIMTKLLSSNGDEDKRLSMDYRTGAKYIDTRMAELKAVSAGTLAPEDMTTTKEGTMAAMISLGKQNKEIAKVMLAQAQNADKAISQVSPELKISETKTEPRKGFKRVADIAQTAKSDFGKLAAKIGTKVHNIFYSPNVSTKEFSVTVPKGMFYQNEWGNIEISKDKVDKVLLDLTMQGMTQEDAQDYMGKWLVEQNKKISEQLSKKR